MNKQKQKTKADQHGAHFEQCGASLIGTPKGHKGQVSVNIVRFVASSGPSKLSITER